MKSKSIYRLTILAVVALAVVAVMAAKQRGGSAVEPDAQPVETAAALPRLLDLGSDSCVPCKAMQPELAELEKEYAGRLKVEFIDVWKDAKAGEQYGVKAIPTQIFYDAEGKEIFRHTGFYSKDDILKAFRDNGVALEPAS